MKLWDRVNIHTRVIAWPHLGELLHADIPAHVGRSQSLTVYGDVAVGLKSEVRAILPAELPLALDPTLHTIEWRGIAFVIDGVPMLSTRRGRPHHWTVQLSSAE